MSTELSTEEKRARLDKDLFLLSRRIENRHGPFKLVRLDHNEDAHRSGRVTLVIEAAGRRLRGTGNDVASAIARLASIT